MKTPEEIKRGLECCIYSEFECSDECPYAADAPNCSKQMLADVYAQFAKVPRWISVEERLPEEQGDCLVLYSFGETNADYFTGVMYFIRYDERPHFENDGLYGLHVTHWMPLPEPPKEGQR